MAALETPRISVSKWASTHEAQVNDDNYQQHSRRRRQAEDDILAKKGFVVKDVQSPVWCTYT